ncbi:MAG: hypothetical protein ACQKBW_12505 [Puniceicoccales bacterium]
MSESLWPQLRLKAETEEELIEAYRKVYLDTYVRDEEGNQRIFYDWNKSAITFAAGAFDHAFSKSKNYRLGTGVHDGGFAHDRARRILWIAEVLKASAGSIQRYSQTVRNSRGANKKRRTYVVVEENYVVILDDPKSSTDTYKFVTAIPANKSYIDSEIRRKSFLAETKRGG